MQKVVAVRLFDLTFNRNIDFCWNQNNSIRISFKRLADCISIIYNQCIDATNSVKPLSPVVPSGSLAIAWKYKSTKHFLNVLLVPNLISATHMLQDTKPVSVLVTSLNGLNIKQVYVIKLHNMLPVVSSSAGSPCAISLYLFISFLCAASLHLIICERVRSRIVPWWERKERASQQGEGYIRIQSLPWPIYLQPGDR